MTDSAVRVFVPGARFGAYRIEGLIGEGGMGSVYAATHVGLDKPVALKTLRSNLVGTPEAHARFLREARAAAALRHAHVVDVSDVGEVDGVLFLAMEMLDGEPLSERLRREGALAASDVADMMLPVCSAVAAAHDAGIIHRDLKPDNIFLTSTRRGAPHPKLLDFGIAQRADASDHKLTQTGALLGTPYYMSPEQATGSKDVSARSDQYSLGVILYECLTHTRPFERDNLYALLHAIDQGAVTPPRARRADLDLDLEAVVLRAMARDSAARFASVRDLAIALYPFASESSKVLWRHEFADAPATEARAAAASLPPAPAAAFSSARSTLDAVETAHAERRAPSAERLTALVVCALIGAALFVSTRSGTHASSARASARPAVVATPTPAAPEARAAAPEPSLVDASPATVPTTPAARPSRSVRRRARRAPSDREAATPTATPEPRATRRGTNGIPF